MLDATLALFVLTIGVLLILSFYIDLPQPTQVGFISKDLLNFFSDTKIKDLNNQYAGIGGELWRNGSITDPENSLLQQIGEFYNRNDLATAEKFVQNVSDIIPGQFKYEIWIDNTRIYPKNASQEHLKSKANTNLLLTSKKLTFGIQNKSTSGIWGPFKAEVFVWER